MLYLRSIWFVKEALVRVPAKAVSQISQIVVQETLCSCVAIESPKLEVNSANQIVDWLAHQSAKPVGALGHYSRQVHVCPVRAELE